MLTGTVRFLFALVLAAGLAFAGIAQEKKPERDYVENTGFKGKIFELKHREPSEVFQTLSPLGSGFKGATMTVNNELKTITVRDFPENIAAIEEAIKRLDVPRTARAETSIDLSMHVLLANKSDSGGQLPGEVSADLKDVVKQLQTTFAFKNYHLAATIVQRTKTHNNRTRSGIALSGNSDARWDETFTDSTGNSRKSGNTTAYQYMINSLSLLQGATPSIQFEGFAFEFGKTRIQTNLDVRDGEKLVVGTASFGDKAMILVLTAKIIK
ncbi:MAG: secretin N-terminal domain-containing protein [Blastocatellia bacterium]